MLVRFGIIKALKRLQDSLLKLALARAREQCHNYIAVESVQLLRKTCLDVHYHRMS